MPLHESSHLTGQFVEVIDRNGSASIDCLQVLGASGNPDTKDVDILSVRFPDHRLNLSTGVVPRASIRDHDDKFIALFPLCHASVTGAERMCCRGSTGSPQCHDAIPVTLIDFIEIGIAGQETTTEVGVSKDAARDVHVAKEVLQHNSGLYRRYSVAPTHGSGFINQDAH